MKTGKILRRIAMLVSFIMMITSTVGTTYGYIVTSTETIENVFISDITETITEEEKERLMRLSKCC